MPYRIPRRAALFPADSFVKEGAVGAKLSGGVKAVTGVYNNVKAVADRAIDVAGKAADTLVNYDTPNDGSNSKPVEPRQGINMANMDGIRYAQILGPMTGEGPEPLPPTDTGKPETRLHILAMMPCHFQSIQISTSDVPGTVIGRVPITACPELFRRTSGALFTPTMLEHIATGFTYWRGSIEFTIQFVGPPLANMRVGLATRFGIFGGTVTIPEFSEQYGKIFNYGEEDTVKVTVPYVSPQHWMRVPVPDALGADRLDPERYALGELLIVLITPYQVNETMATSLDMNIFISGGEDIEFKTPGENLARLSFASGDEFKVEMLKSGAVGGDLDDDEVKEVITRPLGGPVEETMVSDGTQGLWGRIFTLEEVPWAPSDLVGTLLYVKRVPDEVIPEGAPFAVYNSFMFTRMHVEMHFGLSTSVSTQGQVVAFFVPVGVNPSLLTRAEVLLGPHVLMKAGRTTGGVVQIPFVHPLNMLETQGANWRGQLGYICIMVFNQFRSGLGAPTQSPTINVSVKFNDMQLAVPNPGAPTFIMGRPRARTQRVNQRE
jgi:hypothetical protein